MLFRRHAVVILATFFSVGCFPVAPGTVGSIVGIPLAWGLSKLSWQVAAAVLLLMIFVFAWIAGQAERQLDVKDPCCIVIDEVAGMAITLLGIPFSLKTAIGGFILFRILDIAKPQPIRWVERHLSGGWGIMLDDVLAAMIANVVLRFGLSWAHA